MKDAISSITEELKAAIVELESDNGLERFVKGHGLQSRYFAFEWSGEHLTLDFRMPYARVLSSEEDQSEDAANVGAALRLAILLIEADGKGLLLSDGEAAISVTVDEYGQRYAITGANGETIDSSDNWDPLITRLVSIFSDVADNLQIIWP